MELDKPADPQRESTSSVFYTMMTRGHCMPQLPPLLSSPPPPRKLSNQARHAPRAVPIKAFSNMSVDSRHCDSIFLPGFHTRWCVDQFVLHELHCVTMHPAFSFKHQRLQPPSIFLSLERLGHTSRRTHTILSIRVVHPRHVTCRRTGVAGQATVTSMMYDV